MNATEINTHPLFYDVLSGEFNPPSDPESRAHTLGRLAYATWLKGTDVNTISGKALNYTPSWAPEVSTTIGVAGTMIDSVILEDLSGLNPNRVFAFNLFLHLREEPEVQIVDSDGDGEFYELELGPELIVVRNHITEIAQDFFDAYAE